PSAAHLAATLGGELILMQAVPPPDSLLASSKGGAEREEAGEVEAAEDLGLVATRLKEDHPALSVAIDVRTGPPADAHVARTEASGAQLVAMATHGRSALGQVLFGSVATAVLRRGTTPLLLTRPWWSARARRPVTRAKRALRPA